MALGNSAAIAIPKPLAAKLTLRSRASAQVNATSNPSPMAPDATTALANGSGTKRRTKLDETASLATKYLKVAKKASRGAFPACPSGMSGGPWRCRAVPIVRGRSGHDDQGRVVPL